MSDPKHSGRNRIERAIGYHFALREDEHVYREDLAEENFRLFLRHQTLMG